MMKALPLLLLIACSSLACRASKTKDSYSFGDQYTYRFENCTLKDAFDYIQNKRNRFAGISFSVRNDRQFESLVLKDVLSLADLLGEIKSATDCEVIRAGRSILIVLPSD